MMNGDHWGSGMGWGMWIIPIAIILIVVFFGRGKSKN